MTYLTLILYKGIVKVNCIQFSTYFFKNVLNLKRKGAINGENRSKMQKCTIMYKKFKKKRCLYKQMIFKKIMPTGEIESGYKKIFRYAVSDSVKIN